MGLLLSPRPTLGASLVTVKRPRRASPASPRRSQGSVSLESATSARAHEAGIRMAFP